MSLSTQHTRSYDSDKQIHVSSTGQRFFYSVPNGVLILLTSFTHLEELVKLHEVIDSNRLSTAHWEDNRRQYAHHVEPLLDVLTSIEALRWVLLVRN